MYEKTLSIDIDNADMLQHINNNIDSVVSRLGGLVACTNSNSRSYMAVALPQSYTKQMDDLLCQLVQDILSISYKHSYLNQRLDMSDSFVAHTLVNCMSVFDSIVDKRSINLNIDQSDMLAIDGYYNFRMRQLKDKWDEIIQLVNNNSQVLHEQDTMLSFIGYMVEGVARTSTLSVSVSDSQYILFDKKHNIIVNTNMPLQHANVYQLAMLDILLHNPRQLNIYTSCDNDDIAQLLQLSQQLYDTKVYKNS